MGREKGREMVRIRIRISQSQAASGTASTTNTPSLPSLSSLPPSLTATQRTSICTRATKSCVKILALPCRHVGPTTP